MSIEEAQGRWFHMTCEGHFTLRPSVKRMKDSSNSNSGKQKFVRLAFTLEANGLQKAYLVALIGNFGTKSLFGEKKLVHNIYGNPNSP
jgi:hypothetical protein